MILRFLCSLLYNVLSCEICSYPDKICMYAHSFCLIFKTSKYHFLFFFKWQEHSSSGAKTPRMSSYGDYIHITISDLYSLGSKLSIAALKENTPSIRSLRISRKKLYHWIFFEFEFNGTIFVTYILYFADQINGERFFSKCVIPL